MNEVEIKFFGAFRKYIPAGRLKLRLKYPCTAIQLKEQIHQRLQEQIPNYKEPNLVFESALATETEVLAEDVSVDEKLSLALLPPVCGG